MQTHYSEPEIAILLGATLMHWGVPFHQARKQDITGEQQDHLDAISDKLIAVRDTAAAKSKKSSLSIDLTEQESMLLTQVLDDCLRECGDNPTDLRIHLKANDRKEVDSLLAKMRSQMASTVTV
jgi:hypothetical protein